MKKKYSSKLAWMGAALCAFVLVACGLKITKVTLSANEIDAEGEVTVTTQFERADDEFDNNHGIYLLYAVRVPQDWTCAQALEAVVNHAGEENALAFVESKPYAALAEFCFPKAGYKWIGFQTTDKVDLDLDKEDGENIISNVTLKAGKAGGDFKLDILSGSFPQDPAVLLTADGKVDVNIAFGRKSDFAAADPKKLTDGTEVFGFSEYLVNASTISPAEKLAAENTLLFYTSTVDDKSYPISAGVDVGNALTDEEIAALQLNVKVNGDDSAVNEIAASEKDNAPVYNLQGVKVADTTVPGIYIKNGKKFVVK